MKIPYKMYIRSLPNSEDRRRSMSELLDKFKWNFEFWDNTHYEDEEFVKFIKNGGVTSIRDYLDPIHKITSKNAPVKKCMLYPSQVANHYSMLKLFRHIENQNIQDKYIIIGEDDLILKDYASEVIDKILPQITSDKFICGIGWGWSRNRRLEHMNHDIKSYRLKNAKSTFRFCNPLFVTNLKTIKYINSNLVTGKIHMPCDVWLHKYTTLISDEISRYLIYPALCNELSFFGRIDSEILPKKSRLQFLSSKKNLTNEEKDKLISLRDEYNNKEKFWEKYWEEKYGL